MPTTPPVRVARHRIVPTVIVKERAGMTSIFASQERKGDWEISRKFRIACVFGAVVLDLREARIPEGTSEIELFVMGGSVEILCPVGVRVEMVAESLLGSAEFTPDPTVLPEDDAPTIRVTGNVNLGSLEVFVRLPGESSREAKKRIRALSGRPSRRIGW